MGRTIISWATHTWNPATGCDRISQECQHCYAESLSLRRGWTRKAWTDANAAENVQVHYDRLKAPFRMRLDPGEIGHERYPIRVFVNSMSDMFHDQVSDAFLAEVFYVMNHPDNAHRVFQVLTKRPERAAEWPGPWGPNIWLGTTCGHRDTAHRIDTLRNPDAQIKFVSAEPLLTPLWKISLAGIDQVVVGGESGAGFRKMEMSWARDLRDLSDRDHCAYFFKQDSAFRTETRCYLVEADGRCMQYRQFPGCFTEATEVPSDNPGKHRELFPVLQ